MTTDQKATAPITPLAVTSDASLSREWERLALDTLARLTAEFALTKNSCRLIDLALLAITGQLRVTGACAVFAATPEERHGMMFRGAGVLHGQRALQRLVDRKDYRAFLVSLGRSVRVDDLLRMPTAPVDLHDGLSQARVAAVTPVIIGDALLGVLGVAARVDNSPFDDGALRMLEVTSNTIAPLLSNSLLYTRLDSLSRWYSDIIDSVGQGVIVFRQDFHVRHVNRAARRLMATLGVDAAWDETALRASDLFDPGRFEGWLDFLSQSTGRRHKDPEVLIARHDNADRVFRAYVSRTSEASADANDIILTLDEVTEQRDIDQRMFELEKFAEQGVMAASIAHELNNYLALILGGIDLARMHLERTGESATMGLLEKLKNHAVAMSRFTAGLTDAGRLASGRKETNLNDIVREVVGFARLQRRYNGISIIMTLADEMPRATLDPDQIAQLLMNLLNNSADAIREKKVREGLISLTTEWDSSHTCIQVTDNGTGMPEDLQQKLFKDGFTTKKDGHGFGMVTCGRILSQHDARHSVSSRLGDGTTIRITFPR